MCFLRFRSHSIIMKWFEAGVSWRFMARIQEEENEGLDSGGRRRSKRVDGWRLCMRLPVGFGD